MSFPYQPALGLVVGLPLTDTVPVIELPVGSVPGGGGLLGDEVGNDVITGQPISVMLKIVQTRPRRARRTRPGRPASAPPRRRTLGSRPRLLAKKARQVFFADQSPSERPTISFMISLVPP
jgi:hypothetical protein